MNLYYRILNFFRPANYKPDNYKRGYTYASNHIKYAKDPELAQNQLLNGVDFAACFGKGNEFDAAVLDAIRHYNERKNK